MVNNIIRQLIDIQNRADDILKSDLSPEYLSSFYRNSNDLKNYLKENVENKQIQSILTEIPEHELKDILKNSEIVEFWGFDLLGLFKKNRLEVEDSIRLIKSKYSSIESIIRNTI